MRKCPQCGYVPPKGGPKGRPVTIDEKKLWKLHAKGLSLREIAAELGCTHGAVAYALKRKLKNVLRLRMRN